MASKESRAKAQQLAVELAKKRSVLLFHYHVGGIKRVHTRANRIEVRLHLCLSRTQTFPLSQLLRAAFFERPEPLTRLS